jgi:hypothetical protein
VERFGGLAISFRQLLCNLEDACGCRVTKLSEIGDITDVDESASGAFYEVTRSEGHALWYAHVEVYSYDLPVLPDLIRSIAVQLDLPEELIFGKQTH